MRGPSSTAAPLAPPVDPSSRQPKAPHRVRRLNVPLVAGTLLAVVLLAPLLYLWRGYQVRRTSAAFLDRAAAREAANEWPAAAGYFHRYLQLNPGDADARIRLAEAFDKSALDPPSKGRAIELYYEALGAVTSPQQPEEARAREPRLRQRLIGLLLEAHEYAPAESEAAKLLETSPSDKEGLRLIALARYGQLRSGGLAVNRQAEANLGSSLLRALASNPGNVELSEALAGVLREEPKLVVYREDADAFATGKSPAPPGGKKHPLPADARVALADTVIDHMVAADPASPKSRLARYRYRLRYRLPGAVDDLKQALERGPKEIDVLLAAAEHAKQEKGSLAETSETMYQRAIELAPAEEKAYVGLGDVLAGQGKLDQAIAVWQKGLRQNGSGSIDLNLRLADALTSRGRLDEVAPDPRSAGKAQEKGEQEFPLTALRRVAKTYAPRLRQADRIALERAIDFVEGKWLVAKGHHAQAIPVLQRVTATKGASDTELTQIAAAHSLLGRAYGALTQWDQAASAHHEAAVLQPNSVEMRLNAAAGWMAARQIERALREYEHAARLKDTATTRLLMAQARFQQQALLPASERSWQPFEAALKDVKQRSRELEEPWRVKVLEASYLVASQPGSSGATGAAGTALELLRQAEAECPRSVPLLATLTLAYQRLARPDDADRAMKKFEEAAKDPARGCALRASLLVQRKQLDEARKILRAGLESLPPGSSGPVRSALVQLELTAGNDRQAARELEELTRAEPSNLVWVVRLADLAFQANDLPGVERWERALRDLEGPGGTYWKYYRGRRLVAQVTTERSGVNDPRFVEADQLRAQLVSQRPSWASAHLLSGLIAELRGRPTQAVEAYGNAIRLGAAEIGIYERIITLLYGLRQFDTADDYLAQLKGHGLGSAEQLLNWESHIADGRADQAIDFAEQQRQRDRALASAERRCREQPKDPLAWIWLGKLRLAYSSTAADSQTAGRLTQEAERAFQEAVRVAPSDVRSHNGLFSFYMRTAQRQRAEETLRTLAGIPDLPAAQRGLTLGAGYEMLGDLARAETEYREVEKLDPGNVQAKQRLAALLIRTNRPEAERILRTLRKVVPSSDFARLNLAQVLASRALAATGPEEERLWQEVEDLLGQSRAEQSRSPLDRRIYATLLYRRGGRENRQRSRDILKGLVEDSQTATDLDHLLLARIYEDESKRARAEGKSAEAETAFQAARREYLQLVRRDKPQAAHLLVYLGFLLDNGRKGEIAPWCQRIEALLADNRQQAAAYVDLLLKHDLFQEAKAPLDRLLVQTPDSTATVALRARWLRGAGKAGEIEPMLAAFAEKLLRQASGDPKREAAACTAIGNLYDSVEQREPAKRWYQRAMKLVPENYASLALSLAHQGQAAEALRICREAGKSDRSPRPALTAAGVLVAAKPTADDFALAEPLLAEAVQQHKDHAILLASVANVRLVQKRPDDAIALYRQALRATPKDIVLMNNLATLLSEDPATLPEALEVINRAVEIGGPQAYLLDTKGVVLVYSNRAKEAVPWLQTAASDASPDPRYHFHLAVAYDQCGKTAEARASLQAARDKDLAGQFLTEREQRLLADLQGRLSKKP